MRILRKHHRTDANRRGTTAVELAFVLPVFLFLVLSIVEFAHAQMVGNVLRAACRTAVRLGSTGGNSSAQVENHVRQVLSSAVRTAAINVFVKDASEFDAGGLPPANQSQFEAMPAIELADAEARQLFLVRARVGKESVPIQTSATAFVEARDLVLVLRFFFGFSRTCNAVQRALILH
jgi:hypothetical protein